MDIPMFLSISFFQSVEGLLSNYAIDIPACYSNRNAEFTIITLYMGWEPGTRPATWNYEQHQH